MMMKITNVVTLWDFGRKIDLKNRMNKFNADVIKNGLETLLTFASGKIISTGCKTVKNARAHVHSVFPGAKFIRIVNMTAVAHLKDRPNIVNLPGVIYEPEIFPAYLWRRDRLCVVYYATGKLIITGAKSYLDLRKIFSEFKALTGIKRGE